MAQNPPLPSIPVLHGTPVDLFAAQRHQALELLAIAKGIYTPAGIAVADRLARPWLARLGRTWPQASWLGELDEMAALLQRPGIHMLNLSYEWGCSSGAAPSPCGRGARLLRTLDWPFPGLGARVAIVRQSGQAGEFDNVTWPGFCGVLTASAPGRFALAINQAKHLHGPLSQIAAWPFAKAAFLASRGLPPVFLARHVCETARTYGEAVELLCKTPVCAPVFFTLAGIHPHEHCVIERLENRFHLHPGPMACTNHWQFPGVLGERKPFLVRYNEKSAYIQASLARHAGLAKVLTLPHTGFDWLAPPVLCRDTRLAMVANPSQGTMSVVGIENAAPATQARNIQWTQALDL